MRKVSALVEEIRRPAAELMLSASVGEDPELWLVLLTRVGAWGASFGELLQWVAVLGPELPLPTRRAPRWPSGVDPAAVLLTMAPDGIAELFIEACDSDRAVRGLAVRMLDRGPLIPALRDYALGPKGTPEMRRALVRNPATAEADVWAAVRRDPPDVRLLQYAYFHPVAGADLRVECVRRADDAGGFGREFAGRLLRGGFDRDVLRPLTASRDEVLTEWVRKRLAA